MKIEDFLDAVIDAPLYARERMLEAALRAAISHFTSQMKFAHAEDLQRIAEPYQRGSQRCPHTTTHVDPDSFIYDHHVCDRCGVIVKSD